MGGLLRPDEKVEELTRKIKIIQSKRGYRFSLDAVLLAHFVTLRPGEKVIDLGTGSGVIPLLLKSRQPDLTVVGLELQAELADMARRSVELNNLQETVFIQQGDLREAIAVFGTNRFDVVVSNPPYWRKGEGRINPDFSKALARHELECTLTDVIRVGSGILKPQGRFALIHRPERIQELIQLLNEYHLGLSRLRFVQPRLTEPPKFMLIEAVKGKFAKLEIMPVLVIYDEFERYSPELQQIFQR
ncbi:tRNA1(Val) (adenine(37)-N6)-methyltransferase [Calderihabitans maritimus]|uniref:Methyltransferase domain protein n=1 Tax=Calderihabitans maritimus TaxID=1246530 RepID=A0A1Z5HQA3_9FIRM|nr:tRNA1(Val) (adenine(37)-N6)-methyltransferase [Calderihabitans maritimus]GAW91618.1 methyltransferase domain protein [Calderihabitans maritimus]